LLARGFLPLGGLLLSDALALLRIAPFLREPLLLLGLPANFDLAVLLGLPALLCQPFRLLALALRFCPLALLGFAPGGFCETTLICLAPLSLGAPVILGALPGQTLGLLALACLDPALSLVTPALGSFALS
jgi:hypothetical protein